MAMINLQGKLNSKYVVGFYFSFKPQRATLRERWPPSVEDNLKRLEEAGLPYDRQIPKCSNCGGKQTKQHCPGKTNNDIADWEKKWATSRAAARKSVPLSNVLK